MSEQPPLPAIRRIVTSHSDTANAIVARNGPVQATRTGHGPWINLMWSSNQLPCDANASEDMGKVATGLANDGVIYRIVDFPPKSVGMVHRSETLDFVYVLKGEIVLTLDDGSRTVVKENETVVQQATMHGWDNETNEWTRLLVVLVKAEKPVVNGKELTAEVPFKI